MIGVGVSTNAMVGRIFSAEESDPFADLVTEFSPLLLFDIGQGAPEDGQTFTGPWVDQSGSSNDATPSVGDSLVCDLTAAPIGVSNPSGLDYFILNTPITRAGTAFELWAVGFRVTDTWLMLTGNGNVTGLAIGDDNTVRISDETENAMTFPEVNITGRFVCRFRVPNNGTPATYIGTNQASVDTDSHNGSTFEFAWVLAGLAGLTGSGNRLETLIFLPAITDATGSTRVLELINQMMTARGAATVGF